MYRQPIVTAYPISDFLHWKASGQLEITPRFQRRQVWVPKARSYLIDSILRQMPIPPLFIRLTIDPAKRSTIREVVDGQQRIRAIFDYIKGDFAVLKVHNPEFAGLPFGELPEEIQRNFLSYKLAVNLLEGVTDSEVLRIFARLNTYTVPLNKQELRNAEFFGAFKQTVYDIAFTHLAFWRNNNILRDQDIARMADAELVSELLVTMMDGFQTTKDSDLRRYYKTHDDSFPEAEKLSEQFEKTVDTIGGLFENRLAQMPFRRVPLFYSLFAFIYDALFGLPGESSPKLTFSKREKASILDALGRLGEIIQSREPPEDYLPLVEAARRGTADVGKRRLRHRYFWQSIKNAIG
jgi:hypothetical protein